MGRWEEWAARIKGDLESQVHCFERGLDRHRWQKAIQYRQDSTNGERLSQAGGAGHVNDMSEVGVNGCNAPLSTVQSMYEIQVVGKKN